MSSSMVSPLRQRMIDDMRARKLGRHSERSHIASCKRFAAFLKRSPETATADDVRNLKRPPLQAAPASRVAALLRSKRLRSFGSR